MKIAAVSVIVFFLIEVQQARPSLAQAQNASYGAIAYSWSSGWFGISSNLPTRPDAERSAKNNCGRADCEILLLFRGECAALAEGQVRRIGLGRAARQDYAENAARENCQKNGGQDCRKLTSACTR